MIQEEAAVQVGSNKVPLPPKLCSRGLMRVDTEVNRPEHS